MKKTRLQKTKTSFYFNQRTIGPEKAHLKPDLGVLKTDVRN